MLETTLLVDCGQGYINTTCLTNRKCTFALACHWKIQGRSEIHSADFLPSDGGHCRGTLGEIFFYNDFRRNRPMQFAIFYLFAEPFL
jgi:hypothetical protein